MATFSWMNYSFVPEYTNKPMLYKLPKRTSHSGYLGILHYDWGITKNRIRNLTRRQAKKLTCRLQRGVVNHTQHVNLYKLYYRKADIVRIY